MMAALLQIVMIVIPAAVVAYAMADTMRIARRAGLPDLIRSMPRSELIGGIAVAVIFPVLFLAVAVILPGTK